MRTGGSNVTAAIGAAHGPIAGLVNAVGAGENGALDIHAVVAKPPSTGMTAPQTNPLALDAR